MSKKIGLLTVYFADYGSFFQATALYKAIESLGYKCTIIHESLRYRKSPKIIIIIKLFLKICPTFIAKRILNFIPSAANTYRVLQTDLKNYSISKPFPFSNRFNPYNSIVIGSDELWSFTNKKVKYFPEYFGIDIPKPHISYAVSAASVKPCNNKKIMGQIQNGLSSFNFIGVRDRITKQWVESMQNKNTTVVLDPTLLNPYFKKENTTTLEYIGVYGEDFSEKQIKAIKTFSEQKKMPLVALSWKHNWCNRFFDAKNADELQLGFAQSSYIMSSTFHGTIFAIIQRRDFTSFITECRGKKVIALLESLHLDNRLFDNHIIEEKIDYDKVEKIIEPLRKKSLFFLKSSLEKTNGGIDETL